MREITIINSEERLTFNYICIFQVASLLGVGLVYANTGHRHMVEVCVQELGKLPGPELENAMDRESYSLTAGLALGVITMGQECNTS